MHRLHLPKKIKTPLSKGRRKQIHELKNHQASRPKSLPWPVNVCIPTPDAFVPQAFSACANDLQRHNVRLRRLGTVGIFPFLLNINCFYLCRHSITFFVILQDGKEHISLFFGQNNFKNRDCNRLLFVIYSAYKSFFNHF